MSNDTMEDVLKSAMEDVDLLSKKSKIAINILNDSDASYEQKCQACKSVANASAEFFSSNKPDCLEDSPSSSSCSSGPVNWSNVMHKIGTKSEYIANKTFE